MASLEPNPRFPFAFRSFEAIPISREPAKVLIRWELDKTNIVLSDYEFRIDRGESPDQIPDLQNTDIDGDVLRPPVPEGDAVNQYQIHRAPIAGTDFHEFVDHTPLLRNLNKDYWYRIRARKRSTQEEISTTPFAFTENLDFYGLYVVDEHHFKFKDVSGEPVFVHLRKTEGAACSSCFDPVQNKRTRSHCTECFGTNWAGGFYSPISTYAEINTPTKVSVIEQWGERQPSETDCLFSNYPLLKPGDVIRRLQGHRLYRVVQVSPIAKRQIPMIQAARLTAVVPGDIEYGLPIDQNLYLELMSEFREVLRLRES